MGGVWEEFPGVWAVLEAGPRPRSEAWAELRRAGGGRRGFWKQSPGNGLWAVLESVQGPAQGRGGTCVGWDSGLWEEPGE